MNIAALVIIFCGIFFMTVSALGIVRFPDFYSRNHAVGKSETLGSMLVLFGLALYNGFEISSLKLLAIILFIALANPTATHAIAREALRAGLQPWIRRIKDVDSHTAENKSIEKVKEND
jgi:multicomponent Na+:H+ antiporter subunit G